MYNIIIIISHRNHLDYFKPIIDKFLKEKYYITCLFFEESFYHNDLKRHDLKEIQDGVCVHILKKNYLMYYLDIFVQKVLKIGSSSSLYNRVRKFSVSMARYDICLVALKNNSGMRNIINGFHYKIPVISFQHILFPKLREGYENYPVNKVLLWGESEIYINQCKQNNIDYSIVGAPQFGNLKKIDENHNGKILLYATQPPYNELVSVKKKIIEDLCIFCNLNPAYKLIIKLHPKDSGHIEYSAIKKYKQLNISFCNRNIEDLIKSSDLVLTVYSNIVLYTLIHGKNLIILDYDKLASLKTKFVEAGIGFNVYNYCELENAIKKNIHDTKRIDGIYKARLIYYKIIMKYTGKKSLELILNTIKTMILKFQNIK